MSSTGSAIPKNPKNANTSGGGSYDSVFASLCLGAKFNRKRFAQEISYFHPASNASTVCTTSAEATAVMKTTSKETENKEPTLPSLPSDFLLAQKLQDQGVTSGKLKRKLLHMNVSVQDSKRSSDIKRIRVEDDTTQQYCPDLLSSFSSLKTQFQVPDFIINAISEMSYQIPTPIQTQAIPCLLARKDIIACAPTGSGKTLAFLLPIIITLLHEHSAREAGASRLRAVVITPTVELAQQIRRELAYFLHLAFPPSPEVPTSGSGVPQKNIKQKKTTPTDHHGLRIMQLTNRVLSNPIIRDQSDILISTPLRVVKAIEEYQLQMNQVQFFVIDEADRLLHGSFQSQLDKILSHCSHSKLVKAVFSATMPEPVERLAQSIMRNPVSIVVGGRVSSNRDVDQRLVFCSTEESKILTIRQIMCNSITTPISPASTTTGTTGAAEKSSGSMSTLDSARAYYADIRVRYPLLFFLQSKERTEELYKELRHLRLSVGVIHGDRSQDQREAVVKAFRQGKLHVLICSELMARGIDFKGVGTVVNFDFPTSIVSYVHRVGRTGRAGQRGLALTLFTPEDVPLLRSIANLVREAGCPVEPWMLKLRKLDRKAKRKLRTRPTPRPHLTLQEQVRARKLMRAKQQQKQQQTSPQQENSVQSKGVQSKAKKSKSASSKPKKTLKKSKT